jgi:hypothetical protein
LTWIVLVMALLLPLGGLRAQDAPALPPAYQLKGLTHIPQQWNNCGPATLQMGLTYFGYPANQDPAADWLKPTSEDGNVSPWQMVEYVNRQLPGTTRALVRVGGDLTTIKTFLANQFPIIIEEGYDPEPDKLGWMGHYLLISGYDDGARTFKTQDSYQGPNRFVSYDSIEKYWGHFNNTYLVLYNIERETEVMTLLGEHADATKNALKALELNRQRALKNPKDAFAWFNLGTNYVLLGEYDKKAYQYAATAYDQARSLGLPWRMLWYQFGPYIAYNAVGRYQDVIDLAHVQLKEPGTSQFIEETFYYAGLAREGLGDAKRALSNYDQAIALNSNFTPARDARARLIAAGTTDTAANTSPGG